MLTGPYARRNERGEIGLRLRQTRSPLAGALDRVHLRRFSARTRQQAAHT